MIYYSAYMIGKDPVGGVNCLVCGINERNSKRIGYHVRTKHGLSAKEYTVATMYGGIEPRCLECGGQVRYVALGFKRYCKEHSYKAESEAGRVGGKKKINWNKGRTKNDHPLIASLSERAKGPGNHFFGKKHTKESGKKIADKNRLKPEVILARLSERDDIELVSSLDSFQHRQFTKLDFRCKKCDRILNMTLTYFERGTRCRRCFPVGSAQEMEISRFIRNLGIAEDAILMNDRTAIAPLELDVYVPDRAVAVEHHGLYWHGLYGDDKKDLHHRKFSLCEQKNIKLLQFFADEWENKRPICESIIRHRFGLSHGTIGARSCTVEKLEPDEGREFLERCHIDGATRSSAYFGLRAKDGRLLSVMSMRSPHQAVHRIAGTVEISRFASNLNQNVPGALQRLLKVVKAWAIAGGYRGILTYSDLRFGSGDGYLKAGFEPLGRTGSINYWYTDGIQRFDRFKFRAQPGKPEKQVAEEAGVVKVFGAGHRSFLLKL